MATFEKGVSYNFMVERIANAKCNYYFVIHVEHEECWIKMYPFEIYQNPRKNIIRCEYRGVDSFGSHIFIEDKLSILYELYKEKEICNFRYLKESIDTEGESFSVLTDKYGLTHRLYETLPNEQKENNRPITCIVKAIDKTTKALILQIVNTSKKDNQPKHKDNIWIGAEELFQSIEKEELLNEYFYNNLNSHSKTGQPHQILLYLSVLVSLPP